ncbi:hypothetical protein P168DRAFT_301923 [Aspergillus campestris IBT 28561]|uniref:Zn(2)-C6 fungal-type domain-containing protein n=1 Tax=Aspergillus campestris (strain IBT 28561) TaxID=1392248 RepID=A0A2I1DHT4_ASPC2|nr:uncharacterized protein P168DRAFT_301923 [Aspergillus campestris IBT 28561]PKY09428.1 hypothetical protein P168DRAFT_301923 [Aspergillus campestris IBT 28561]
MEPPVSRTRKRQREFTGCWRCRGRKVKCDNGFPCSACKRLGFECDSSSTRLVWINGKESYRSAGRRYMHCERTWANYAALDPDVVDLLIARLDDDETSEAPWPSGIDYNPFSVFPAAVSISLGSNMNQALVCNSTKTPQANQEEKLLFHHYVDYVASIMMPFEHPCNPWKRHYPAVSLQYSVSGEKALYHAILAHAAFNFVHLGNDRQKMMRLATSNYNAAIKYVNDSLRVTGKDSGSTLAAIMTLMMAEVYSGNSSKWKHHLQGAWAFLLESNGKEPWNESEFACFSTQSLLIVKIIGATCLTDGQNTTQILPPSPEFTSTIVTRPVTAGPTVSPSINSDLALSSFISTTPQFGFTIGAQRLLLECISTITTVSRQMRSGASPRTRLIADRTVSQLLAYLNLLQAEALDNTLGDIGIEQVFECNPQTSKSNIQELARYQLNAFIFATYIYLYRALLDVPPKRVAVYVSLTFDNITAFSALSSGNISLWPAFIAAVEAYTTRDMESSRRWLEQSTHFGLGNRLAVKSIIEEVWRRRDAFCTERGMDTGLVAVDWRDVIRDLGMDILLI